MLDGKKSSIAVPTALLEADTTNTVFWHCLRFALIGTEKKRMNEDFSKQTLLAFFFFSLLPSKELATLTPALQSRRRHSKRY